ncbi:DegT/DnrJ/EryC1/StrS family aminotransferase [bacterium AH-315-M05]|nr:DegT/DnrJ/EryC1/StrS family aminotransferase [bacterium AH-315-M05]
MLSFSPPRIDQKIIDEVVDTLKSGWITTGPKTKLFEKNLTKYCSNKSTLCVNSATNGMELILRWFGVGEGDEVILPAYTYCATANVIVHCGATPVFVDVGEDFNISVNKIEKAITTRTKVIMPVDFAGLPCDYDEINTLVTQDPILGLFKPTTREQEILNRILILSDSAHSIGAEYKGKKTGTLCDISVFSFHAVKNLTTAEGGAIAFNLPEPFNNDEIYKRLCINSLHGQTKDALSKTRKGEWRYDVVEAGYKCNMTDIQASMGLVELERYDNDTLVKRKSTFDKYTAAFSKNQWAQLPLYETPDKTSSYHVYPLRIKGIVEQQRDLIIKEIFDKEIAVNVHVIPLPMLNYYRSLGYNIDDYPVTLDNYSREISMPVYYNLTDEQIDSVIKAVVESVEKVMT